jgi:hypothetical protein
MSTNTNTPVPLRFAVKTSPTGKSLVIAIDNTTNVSFQVESYAEAAKLIKSVLKGTQDKVIVSKGYPDVIIQSYRVPGVSLAFYSFGTFCHIITDFKSLETFYEAMVAASQRARL